MTLMGMYYPYTSCCQPFLAFWQMCRLYIQAWASALLVSTDRAMPEPQSVGRVTGRTPTLFFVYQQLIIRIPIRDVVGCDYC